MRCSAVCSLVILTLVVGLAAGQSARQRFLNKAPDAWAKDLQSGDARVRRTAAFALGKCGGDAASHVGALIRALDDRDEGVREAAAFAIGEIGILAAPEAVAPLVRLLEGDPAPAVRRSAAYALGKLGSLAEEATGPLRQALKHPDPRVRQNAAWALGQIKTEAVEAAVPDLSKLLRRTEDPLVRRDAAVALGQLGEMARTAVPALRSALSDPEAPVQAEAVVALGKIGPDAGPAVPQLVAILQTTTDEEIRREAVLALGQIGGPELVKALPQLRGLLSNPDPLMREAAAAICANLGEEAYEAVPELAAALKDSEVRVRRMAALALCKAITRARTQAAQVLPAMLHALEHDPDRQVRQYLAWSFLSIPVRLRDAHPKALHVLVRVARKPQDPDENIIRYEAARAAVLHFGADATEVVPTLIENLKDSSVRILESADTRTSSGGIESGQGGTRVEEKGSGDGRVFAAQALGWLGAAAGPEAKAALEEAARDPTSAKLREAAKKALEKF